MMQAATTTHLNCPRELVLFCYALLSFLSPFFFVTLRNNERGRTQEDLVACIYVCNQQKREREKEKRVVLAQLNYFSDHSRHYSWVEETSTREGTKKSPYSVSQSLKIDLLYVSNTECARHSRD